jgi:hypothetical protein
MAANHDDAPTVIKFFVPKLFLFDVSGPGFGDTSTIIFVPLLSPTLRANMHALF